MISNDVRYLEMDMSKRLPNSCKTPIQLTIQYDQWAESTVNGCLLIQHKPDKSYIDTTTQLVTVSKTVMELLIWIFRAHEYEENIFQEELVSF